MARLEIQEALRLDPDLAEAHATNGNLEEITFHWEAAENEYQRAIAIDPSYATARQWYSNLLSVLGRHKEAIEQARIGAEADPLSPMIRTQLGVAFYYARQYDEAIATLRTTLQMQSGFQEATNRLADAYAGKGLYKEAENVLANASANGSYDDTHLATSAYIEGAAGHIAKEQELIRELEGRKADAYDLLCAYSRTGEQDKAIALLQRALAERTSENYGVDQIFDPLRSNPQFGELTAQLHLKH